MLYEMALSIEVRSPSNSETIVSFPGRYIRFQSDEYAKFDPDQVIAEAMRHIRDAVASVRIIDAENPHD